MKWICRACMVLIWLGHSTPVQAVDSLNGLRSAIKKAGPGTTVQLADGSYQADGPISIKGLRGTAEAPIVLRAEHRGQAVIRGAAGFVLRDCEHLVIEGFRFTHDADQQAVLLDNCRHVRITRSTFQLSERSKPRHWEHWLTIQGARSGDNRIDHNLFARKENRGSHIYIGGDDQALVCSKRDRVDHNHFRDVVFADGQNGHETIRTGGNDLGASGRSSLTVIEDNLLERCSGEDEILSLKSSENIVRHNTLLNCRGAICLRLGNRSVVAGNFIIATDAGPARGGVKLFGFEHQVVNNYFFGLTGRRHEAPLALVPGMYDTPTTDKIGKQYDDMTAVPPTRCLIAFNTWIDCAPLMFGFAKEDKGWKLLPGGCIFTNNLVVHTKPKSSPLVDLGLLRDLKAYGNLADSGGDAPANAWAAWFRWQKVELRHAENEPFLWRLTAAIPALDGTVEGMTLLDDDIFGRPRTDRRDIGAEQFSAQAAVRGPLTPADVGPSAP